MRIAAAVLRAAFQNECGVWSFAWLRVAEPPSVSLPACFPVCPPKLLPATSAVWRQLRLVLLPRWPWIICSFHLSSELKVHFPGRFCAQGKEPEDPKPKKKNGVGATWWCSLGGRSRRGCPSNWATAAGSGAVDCSDDAHTAVVYL